MKQEIFKPGDFLHSHVVDRRKDQPNHKSSVGTGQIDAD